jgi:hypothetical protein
MYSISGVRSFCASHSFQYAWCSCDDFLVSVRKWWCSPLFLPWSCSSPPLLCIHASIVRATSVSVPIMPAIHLSVFVLCLISFSTRCWKQTLSFAHIVSSRLSIQWYASCRSILSLACFHLIIVKFTSRPFVFEVCLSPLLVVMSRISLSFLSFSPLLSGFKSNV